MKVKDSLFLEDLLIKIFNLVKIMVKIALIGCTSKKQDYPCKAIEMYTKSNYFNLKLDYCKKINVDNIFILSAKYGLLEPETIIEPYDLHLGKTSKDYRIKWSQNVLNDLKEKTNLENDEFIILAGNDYMKYLIEHIPNNYNPVKGLGIGKQLKFFKEFECD